MNLYVISGSAASGRTTLARKLVGETHVWSMPQARARWGERFLEKLVDNLRQIGSLVGPPVALDGGLYAEDIEILRDVFPHYQILHFFVRSPRALEDGELERRLYEMADYIIDWRTGNVA